MVKGIILVIILIAAIKADADHAKPCHDKKELEVACKSAIEAADELLQQKDAKTIYLESVVKRQQSQIETQANLMLEMSNKPWYADPRYTFLLGIITTGVLYESFSNKH